MQSYEKYVRDQLTKEQNRRLDNLVKTRGPIYLDDLNSVISEVLDIASYSTSKYSESSKTRLDVEAPFLIEHMNLYPWSKVFDACLGTGATTIGLMTHGIKNIFSNELDEAFMKRAYEHARKRDVSLTCTSYDWRQLPDEWDNKYDAGFCLGNSFTYLMQYPMQLQVMDKFYKSLKPGAKFAIDTRNYTELLRGNFLNKGTGPYRGIDRINMTPFYVASDMVIFRYALLRENMTKLLISDLLLNPIKDGEIENLMRTTGFSNIKRFGDYKEDYDPKKVDFITIIGTKG